METLGSNLKQKAVIKDHPDSATTCINHWPAAEVDPRAFSLLFFLQAPPSALVTWLGHLFHRSRLSATKKKEKKKIKERLKKFKIRFSFFFFLSHSNSGHELIVESILRVIMSGGKRKEKKNMPYQLCDYVPQTPPAEYLLSTQETKFPELFFFFFFFSFSFRLRRKWGFRLWL
jgi:hypothetical protein